MCSLTQDVAANELAFVGPHAGEKTAILHGHDHFGVERGEAVELRIDARLRIVAAFGFAALIVATTRPSALAAALGVAVCAAFVMRAPAQKIRHALAALDGSMLMVMASLPFTIPGEPLITVFGFGASAEGLQRAAEIAVKANAVLVMMLALLGTADLTEIGHALEWLRLPPKMVHLLMMTVRYIDVLGREYRRLRTAMTVRGFRMGCNMHTWRTIGYLFGMLFVRSLERAERISAAMRCRGFNGRFLSLAEMAFTRRDAVFSVVAVALALSLGLLQLV